MTWERLAWEWLVVDATGKGSVLLLIAAVAALGMRRRSAAARHVVWTAGLAGVLLIAPLSRVTPDWRVALPEPAGGMERVLVLVEGPPSATTSAGRLVDAVAAPAAPGGRFPWVLSVWGMGAALPALAFTIGGWRLSRQARSARPVDDARIAGLVEDAAGQLDVSRGRFRLRWAEGVLTPMTWGIRKPFILIPAEMAAWDDERVRQVLLHEIAHVKRWDVGTQLASSTVCVMCWFNPLVWWAARRMLVERERACDDLVLACGVKPSTYAHELLEIARAMGAD